MDEQFSAEHDQPSELVGSVLRISYDNGTSYVVDYLAEDCLRWRSEQGTPLGELERAQIVRLGERRWMVSWLAVNGVTVTQVLDLEEQRATSFMTLLEGGERRAELLEGSIELLD